MFFQTIENSERNFIMPKKWVKSAAGLSEEQKDFVMELISGHSPTDICQQFSVRFRINLDPIVIGQLKQTEVACQQA